MIPISTNQRPLYDCCDKNDKQTAVAAATITKRISHQEQQEQQQQLFTKSNLVILSIYKGNHFRHFGSLNDSLMKKE